MSTLGKKTVEDIEVKGRNVLVRCDFNVPMKDGVITNDNRIVAALPTIKKLIENGGRVILCSHLGKPKNGPEEKFSLAPVAVRLSELLGKAVVFANDDNVAGENAKAAVAAMQDGDVVLLQNTRFRKEETKNLPEFSKDLADLVGTDGAYVNDAFGSAHRAHCSTAGVTDYIKDTAVGYLMEKEIRYLGNAVNDPVRPVRGHPGRREGRRQAERHREPAEQGGHPDHRRRHGLHLPERQGLRSGQQLWWTRRRWITARRC